MRHLVLLATGRSILAGSFVLVLLSGAPAFAGHDRCTSCHGDGLEGSGPAEVSYATCSGCHSPARTADVRPERDLPGHLAVDGSKAPGGMHVAPGRPSCGTCHDPHGAGGRNLLRDDGDRARLVFDGRPDDGSMLCLTCHVEHGRWRGGAVGMFGRHPVGITVPRGRMAFGNLVRMPLADVRGTDDPSDDVIACVTCHDVHGSRNAHLLRWTRGESRAWCTGCHPVNGSPRGNELLVRQRSRAVPRRSGSDPAEGRVARGF